MSTGNENWITTKNGNKIDLNAIMSKGVDFNLAIRSYFADRNCTLKLSSKDYGYVSANINKDRNRFKSEEVSVILLPPRTGKGSYTFYVFRNYSDRLDDFKLMDSFKDKNYVERMKGDWNG